MKPIARHRSSCPHLADVDAVDEQAAAGDVVEARDEVDERGLAAAGAADDRGHLAGPAEKEMSFRTGDSASG